MYGNPLAGPMQSRTSRRVICCVDDKTNTWPGRRGAADNHEQEPNSRRSGVLAPIA